MSSIPYKKKKVIYKRKRPGPPASRWSVYGGAGTQLWKDVMYLKTLINSEPHAHYVESANNFNWNGVVVSLCDVPQGDTVGDRSGNRVLGRYLNCKWQVTGGAVNAFYRVILFRYWGENSTAAPTVTVAEVLRTVGTQYAPLSHLNDDNTGPRGDRARRIEVHRNEVFACDQTMQNVQMGNWDVEVNGVNVSKKDHTEWAGAATGEPTGGGFYMIFIGNSVTNAAYALSSKFMFYDN